jgi:DNA primase
MDADPVGRAAALMAGENLRYAGLDVRIAVLANGLDPADYLTRTDANLDTFHPDNGLPLIALQAEKAIATQGDRMQWIEGRLAAARTIAGYLTTYPASYTARQIGWLADALKLDASTVTFELTEAYRSQSRSPRARLNEPELSSAPITITR